MNTQPLNDNNLGPREHSGFRAYSELAGGPSVPSPVPAGTERDVFCWLFTALGHGGDLDDASTWAMHAPTAERAVALLAESGWRLVQVPNEGGVMVTFNGVVRSW